MTQISTIPAHVAIIMDGNRRWAQSQGLSAVAGHRKGAETLRNITRAAGNASIRHLTVFAFSSENWARPDHEVKGLMGLINMFVRDELKTLVDENVCLRIIGSLDDFPSKTRQLLNDAVRDTADNDGMILTVALGYGGMDDITRATRHIAARVASGELQPEQIDAECIKRHLYTAQLPAVDLLLRCGCEKRISNFMLWDISYAELVFRDTLWPAFTEQEFAEVLEEFGQRHRRFGGDGEAWPADLAV